MVAVSDYKIVRKLGQSAQSVSYLAHLNDKPNHLVVLKRMAANVVRPSDVNIFLRLRHPNVVPCLQAMQHEDQLVLVTPYYEGGDLEHHVANLQKAKKRVETDTVVRWFVQIVRALQYCHDQKIIHRDLKPSNIYLSKDFSRVYLSGFALAKALDKSISTASTLVGSPVNLSPEVISGSPYSFSSDVWSLGVMLYEIVSEGTKPFQHPSFAQVVMKVCNGQYEPIPKELKVPKFILNAIDGMLQVDTSQRWVLAELVESDAAFLKADQQLQQEQQQQQQARANSVSSESNVGVVPSSSSQPSSASSVRTVTSAASSSAATTSTTGAVKTSRSTSVNNNNQVVAPTTTTSKGLGFGLNNKELNNGVARERSKSIQRDEKEKEEELVRLSSSEELSQWVQWKKREFAQIEATLKKIAGEELPPPQYGAPPVVKNKANANIKNTKATAAAIGGVKMNPASVAATAAAANIKKNPVKKSSDPFYDPESPVPVAPVAKQLNQHQHQRQQQFNFNNINPQQQQQQQQQAMLALPQRNSNQNAPKGGRRSGAAQQQQEKNHQQQPISGRRENIININKQQVPAPPPPAPQNQNEAQQHQILHAHHREKEKQLQKDVETEQKRLEMQAQSAEKRQQQRTELQQKMAQGRKLKQKKDDVADHGEVVIATPSRALLPPTTSSSSSAGAQQQHHHGMGLHQHQNIVVSEKDDNNKASPRSSLKEEIAKRRAEQAKSPRGTFEFGGTPELEIVVPQNLKRALDMK